MGVNISEHAAERAKSRFSLKRDALERLAERALWEGIGHRQANGRLKRYFDMLYLQNRTANNVRIYGEVVFLFNGDTLITLWRVPANMMKIVRRLQDKNKSATERGE